VMYLGKVVEIGPVERVFTKPQHPYTVALISAVPKVEAHDAKDRLILEGEIPSPISPPSGCRFRHAARCNGKCRLPLPTCRWCCGYNRRRAT
jgi:oligopeptide/dipeptide ABC transporter ATP-binding protein